MPALAAARLRSLAEHRVLLAPDTLERHLIVAQLVGAPSDLVDVGGMPGQLAGFLPRTRVLAVNVEAPADLVVPADRLPFEDATFACSTSLDVLEHVKAGDRARFVREQLRVTRGRAVLCCPLGTPEHAKEERAVAAWHRETVGTDNRWLAEHADNGLPTLDELRAAFAGHPGPVRFLFHGDVRVVNEQFKQLVLARHRRRPADVLRYVRLRLPYRPRIALQDTPSPWSNRVFVVADPPVPDRAQAAVSAAAAS
ncbi:MAG TPA: methyltransferase domain-containing protein [Conexibacter sp.]|nr:methyltransferase domain-containing protein [Conexibacter sp.]